MMGDADRSCPKCGGTVAEIGSSLTELGYRAEDLDFQCVDCHHSFACGEPVGVFEHDVVDDVWCDCCNESRGHLYQIKEHDRKPVLVLRFKCPNCYYVWTRQREFVDGVITVGYDDVMGEAAREHGFESEDSE